MYLYEELKVTLKEAYKATDYKEFLRLKKRLIELLDKMFSLATYTCNTVAKL